MPGNRRQGLDSVQRKRQERSLMNEEQKHSMLIHFNDGSKKLLEFSAPVADTRLGVLRL